MVAVQAHGTCVTTGDVVLALHGYPSSSAGFSDVIEPLVTAGYRVLAVDMPGFGRSGGARFGPRSEGIMAANGEAQCPAYRV